MELRYLLRVLSGARLKNLNGTVRKIQEKTGRSRLSLLMDIAGCTLRYGAGYNDYSIFEFYHMTPSERATYMTRLKNKKLISLLNQESHSCIFNEKNRFDERFAPFLRREVRDLAKLPFADFERFIAAHPIIFAKPYVGESGKGIERLNSADFETVEAMWQYLKDPARGFGMIEQPILQHPDAERIYPHAVNCLRIVTLVWQDEVHILYAVFKMGNSGKYIDNLDNGGVACHFDLDSGEITGQGHTQLLVNFDAHPMTGIPFIGYKLPFMAEVKDLVRRAARVVPEIRYVGWDVCLMPDGPAIVEGNDYPGYDFPQLPDPGKPKAGLLAQVRALGLPI